MKALHFPHRFHQLIYFKQLYIVATIVIGTANNDNNNSTTEHQELIRPNVLIKPQ